MNKFTEWEGEIGRVTVKTFHGEVTIKPPFSKKYTLDLFDEPDKSITNVIMSLLKEREELNKKIDDILC